MTAFRLLIEYDGTRYSGWQSQGNTPRTVQGKLLAAAREAFGDAELGGAGRTDAGVHATGQVAHLYIRERVPVREIQNAMNDRLPQDIHVLDVRPAPDRFHARHDADARVYIYQISRRRTAFAKPFVWWIRDVLDVEAMRAAASVIPGMHDFNAFSDKRSKTDSTRVVVEDVSIATDGEVILVRIRASHFLWKMVRKLVAAIVECGRGTMTADDIAERLRDGGPRFEPSAPPSGLFLEAVLYPGETFERPLVAVVPVHPAPRAQAGGPPHQRPRKTGTRRA